MSNMLSGLAAMLGGMMLYRLFSVVRCVSKVTVRYMPVVAGRDMIAGFMMLRGFAVVLAACSWCSAA